MLATAIYVRTESGDSDVFIQEDGFNAEGLTSYLRAVYGEEYPWISEIKLSALNWIPEEELINEVFEDIYIEMDKL